MLKRIFLMLNLLAYWYPTHAISDVSPGVDRLWLQTHSRRDFDAASDLAAALASRGLPSKVFLADNGWFVVVAGTIVIKTPSLLPRMVELYDLPSDTLTSSGRSYNPVTANSTQSETGSPSSYPELCIQKNRPCERCFLFSVASPYENLSHYDTSNTYMARVVPNLFDISVGETVSSEVHGLVRRVPCTAEVFKSRGLAYAESVEKNPNAIEEYEFCQISNAYLNKFFDEGIDCGSINDIPSYCRSESEMVAQLRKQGSLLDAWNPPDPAHMSGGDRIRYARGAEIENAKMLRTLIEVSCPNQSWRLPQINDEIEEMVNFYNNVLPYRLVD